MLTATCVALLLAWLLMHVPALGLRGAAIALVAGDCLYRLVRSARESGATGRYPERFCPQHAGSVTTAAPMEKAETAPYQRGVMYFRRVRASARTKCHESGRQSETKAEGPASGWLAGPHRSVCSRADKEEGGGKPSFLGGRQRRVQTPRAHLLGRSSMIKFSASLRDLRLRLFRQTRGQPLPRPGNRSWNGFRRRMACWSMLRTDRERRPVYRQDLSTYRPCLPA